MASRDVRLFLVMVAGLSGQVYVFLAALTNLTVVSRLVAVYIGARRAETAQLDARSASNVVP
jgi:hypothetical protein